MSGVQRYAPDLSGHMLPAEDGRWVSYDDLTRCIAERDALADDEQAAHEDAKSRAPQPLDAERLAADLHDSFHGDTEHRFVDCLHADHWRGKAKRFAQRIPYVAAAYARGDR